MAPILKFLPQAHALSPNTKFRLPPLDGSLNVLEIYDWHLHNNPDHTLFIHSSTPDDVTHISFKHGVHAIHRAHRLFSERFTSRQVSKSNHDKPLIAILAATDHITYITTWLGIVRAGYAVFHISPRNSAAAVAHLLSKAAASHILVSSEPGVRAVLREALEMLDDPSKTWDGGFVSDMPRNEELYPPGYEDAEPEFVPSIPCDVDTTAYFVHSSGTTAFPKPVRWTHRDFIVFAYTLLLSDQDFCNTTLACHSIPPFHGLGILTTMMSAFCGMKLAAFRPKTPAIAPAPDTVFEGAVQTKSDYVFCVPLFIEVWSRDPAKVAHLKKLRGVLYGGGPLNKAVGDSLTQQGVNIYITYGASENGMKAPMLPPPPGMDWEYFTIAKTFHPEFVPFGDGTYELVMLKCATHCPMVLNTKFKGVDAYATGDLLIPHPTKEGYWKVFGRTDDQIMLNTGEKTNPGPLESILCQDLRVQAAVMFGRGRFQNGVVIQPKADYAFDPSDESKLVEFRSAIWATVERMNAYAPQHSRLFKEMIIVMKASKPFTYTPKGSTRRQAILKDYEPEIEALYEAVEETTQQDIVAPSQWSSDGCLAFVRQTVNSVLKTQVKDEDDIFQHGCDSLQATWVRNTISRALRESPATAGRTIPIDAVYAHPSIASLAVFLSDFAASRPESATTSASKGKEMLALVDKYSTDFPQHTGTKPLPEKQAVLVTGTSGGLGANILAELAKLPNVHRVYALNRRSVKGQPVEQRQGEALIERGLDDGILQGGKVVLLEVDYAQPRLGLEESVLSEIYSTVTSIIHNAWRVDFNLSLPSFESQLATTRNLIDLALASELSKPPSIVFTSSISVLSNADPSAPAQEVPLIDPEVAIATGYSESKWIAERILERASTATSSLRTVVVRVGQVSGGVNGAWNTSEWLPSLVASGPAMGFLPNIDADVAWIPLDATAAALADMSLSASPPPVAHLAHPNPVSWSSLFHHFSRQLNIPLVPYGQWLSGLEKTIADTSKTEVQHMRENPALRLLAFFRGVGQAIDKAQAGRDAMGFPMMSTEKARAVAPRLGQVQQLGETDVEHWLRYWKGVGLLK